MPRQKTVGKTIIYRVCTRSCQRGAVWSIVLDYGVFTLPGSAEISPDTDNLLLRGFSGVKISDLPCCSIVNLGTIEKGDYKVGIIEMRFTAGENLYFGMFAKPVDLFRGDKIVREDHLDLLSTLNCNGFDLLDSGSYPVKDQFRRRYNRLLQNIT